MDDFVIEEKKQLVEKILSPYLLALEAKGIGPELLSRRRKQQLNAKSVKHLKIKGNLPEDYKLPPGYRVVTRGSVEASPTGGVILGDIIIEYRDTDWATQLRATEDVEKIMDLHTEKVDLNLSGSVEMLTNFPPEPKSIEEWEEQYRKYHEKNISATNNPPGD